MLIGCLLLLLIWLNFTFLSAVTLCCLEELSVHLRMETGLCSAVLVVAVVSVIVIIHLTVTVTHSDENVFRVLVLLEVYFSED